MTKQEIIQAIQENKIQIKASTDAKFATIRWFDNDSQSWKESNTFIRDIIQGADNFADLDNDTNAPGQNGQEVINNLYQIINENKTELDGKVNKTETSSTNYEYDITQRTDSNSAYIGLAVKGPRGEGDENNIKSITLSLERDANSPTQAHLLAYDKDGSKADYVPTADQSLVTKKYVDNLERPMVKYRLDNLKQGYTYVVQLDNVSGKYDGGLTLTGGTKELPPLYNASEDYVSGTIAAENIQLRKENPKYSGSIILGYFENDDKSIKRYTLEIRNITNTNRAIFLSGRFDLADIKVVETAPSREAEEK